LTSTEQTLKNKYEKYLEALLHGHSIRPDFSIEKGNIRFDYLMKYVYFRLDFFILV
jgi:hypothetical protein